MGRILNLTYFYYTKISDKYPYPIKNYEYLWYTFANKNHKN